MYLSTDGRHEQFTPSGDIEVGYVFFNKGCHPSGCRMRANTLKTLQVVQVAINDRLIIPYLELPASGMADSPQLRDG